ncbi:MAG TPA: hypothetical protein DCG69_03970 [Bacteroidales bacterium]|nr:hypothetical protein [Bacteroidales bacterium]
MLRELKIEKLNSVWALDITCFPLRHVPLTDAPGLYNFKEVIKILKNSGVTISLSDVRAEVFDCFDSFDKAVEYAKEKVKLVKRSS